MTTFLAGHYASVPYDNNTFVTFFHKVFIPNTLLSNFIAIAFTLLNAFLIAQINNRFTIIRSRTFLPIFIFLLLMCSWNETHLVNGSHMALTIFIFSLFYILSMFHNRKATEQAFMGSFLISLSSLFINPLIFIIPVFWIGFILLQSISIRTLIASIIGAITPWILVIVGQFLQYGKIDFLKLFILNVNFDFDLYSFTLVNLIYIAVMSIIFIICLVGMFSNYNHDAIHTRNKINFFVLLIVFIIILSLVFDNLFGSFLPFIALLFSFLVSHPFTLRQNNFYSIVFIIFCVLNIAFVILKYFQI